MFSLSRQSVFESFHFENYIYSLFLSGRGLFPHRRYSPRTAGVENLAADSVRLLADSEADSKVWIKRRKIVPYDPNKSYPFLYFECITISMRAKKVRLPYFLAVAESTELGESSGFVEAPSLTKRRAWRKLRIWRSAEFTETLSLTKRRIYRSVELNETPRPLFLLSVRNFHPQPESAWNKSLNRHGGGPSVRQAPWKAEFAMYRPRVLNTVFMLSILSRAVVGKTL